MIYKSFDIKNYKGIASLSLDLRDNRIITLVGLNESGKTTIMDAIAWFYKLTKGEEPSEVQLNEFRPKGIDFTGDIAISGTLLIEKEDKDKIRKHWKDLNKKSKLEIPDEFTYNHVFSFNLHSFTGTNSTINFAVKTKGSKKLLHLNNKTAWNQLVDFLKTIIPETLFYEDFIFQIPDKISFVKTGQAEDEEVTGANNKTWQLVISDVLKSVNSKLNFQQQVVDKWETDKDTAINTLAQMERALDEKITKRWGDLFGKNKVTFKEIKLAPEYAAGKLYLSFKIGTASKQQFDVKERSKGFKWFFSFLLFTEFRKKRSPNLLFLLDEPASNLHSSAQAKILLAIQELSKESLVIYSTHSHHLINPHWLSGAYICVNQALSTETLEGGLSLDKAKISAIKYYAYVGQGLGSDKISYFQPILDRLDYQPSPVEPIPDIVILEGRNDWYTYKYFERYILKRKKLINFYPGAGKDKLYDIIRLYLSWGQKFIIFLDGDDGGKAKTLYIKEFGYILKDVIFSIDDVLKKPVSTEGIIEEFDQRSIYDNIFGGGSYDTMKKKSVGKLKVNLNYAIEQLQALEKPVKIGTKTKKNFTEILDFLSKQLRN